MALSNFLSWLNPGKRRADRARDELKANAEKALRMKQEADTGTRVPPHQTPNEGMRANPGAPEADATRGREFWDAPLARVEDQAPFARPEVLGTRCRSPEDARLNPRSHISHDTPYRPLAAEVRGR